MKFEVIEKSTGAKMSRSKAGEMMGSTLFDTREQAEQWLVENGLDFKTHEVKGETK